jgi:predicted glycosyltransferase involved in capsule biosynthesis
MKLGIIVPYRNRESHLKKFLDGMKSYFKTQKLKYEIIIVEQVDDKPFNRGKLLNIGYIKAKELKCDYIVFHDIDMIPIEVDYSYSELPLHLATNFELEYDKSKNLTFDDYFGGVTMFASDTFEKINGYSNLYWGWGFEDDDLLFRVSEKKIPIDIKVIGKNEVKKLYGLSFNGEESYIKIPKKDLLNFEKDTSILISFVALLALLLVAPPHVVQLNRKPGVIQHPLLWTQGLEVATEAMHLED